MICRTLGRSGIKVSAIALGCEGFSANSHEEARGMMNFAGANDIHFIDVCDHRRGACEKRSPFGVPVREKMKQTTELFKM